MWATQDVKNLEKVLALTVPVIVCSSYTLLLCRTSTGHFLYVASHKQKEKRRDRNRNLKSITYWTQWSNGNFTKDPIKGQASTLAVEIDYLMDVMVKGFQLWEKQKFHERSNYRPSSHARSTLAATLWTVGIFMCISFKEVRLLPFLYKVPYLVVGYRIT